LRADRLSITARQSGDPTDARRDERAVQPLATVGAMADRDMVGAIVVSGIGRSEDISLTLAPALLVAMILVIGFGHRCGHQGDLNSRAIAGDPP
jgi:hypothetical protein